MNNVNDEIVSSIINRELMRQNYGIELIASENIVSKSVLAAQGSIMCNKYAEGYPGKRYYGGCDIVDEVESLGIKRAKELFQCEYVNMQPHSGASANLAVLFAFLNPGDTILGMSLSAGGHLTHGAYKTLSGTWFNSIQYGVERETGLINYQEVYELAKEHKPKLIIAGTSAYSRVIDWKFFRDVCDEFDCIFMADMAHFAGLVAGGVYPSPLPYADVVTLTTHKTLRGARGGMILSKDLKYEKVLNSAVFPGTQGGPLMHSIAGKTVALGEALTDAFKIYAQNVIKNAKVLSETLVDNGLSIVTGGTDSHLMIVDLRKYNVTGKEAEKILQKVGITCNKNTIPFDELSPFITSGIRFGTPACTTRGFGEAEFKEIGNIITDTLYYYAQNKSDKVSDFILSQEKFLEEQLSRSLEICGRFPIYDLS